MEHFDVIVVGAGISGIGAGYFLQRDCPHHTFVILEGRDAIGGTWDLFRYPGIRSDSDMFTLGYSFRPWTDAKSIAEGESIREYVRETAREYGIDEKIRFRHRVRRASWSTERARWTVQVERADGDFVEISCNFLHFCGGYYDYERPHAPAFAGQEQFAGRIIHPQFWPADAEVDGKRVVVIGSGATAMTLVPALARQGAQVTMLQRSPTYVLALPDVDFVSQWLSRRLSPRAAYAVTRWKNVLVGMAFYEWCRRRPARAKQLLIHRVKKELGEGFDVERHFTPSYNPWEQRLCVVPNGDLFAALKAGTVNIVTDHIERFEQSGVRLKSGDLLEADVIVTATGLELKFLDDIALSVDGQPVDPSQRMTYKAMMLSDVPNLAFSIGYTNASWTLKCDLTAAYVCRLLGHMREGGYAIAMPHHDPSVPVDETLDLTSGFVKRAIDRLPKRGTRAPWRLHQNYVRDLLELSHGQVADGTMRFR